MQNIESREDEEFHCTLHRINLLMQYRTLKWSSRRTVGSMISLTRELSFIIWHLSFIIYNQFNHLRFNHLLIYHLWSVQPFKINSFTYLLSYDQFNQLSLIILWSFNIYSFSIPHYCQWSIVISFLSVLSKETCICISIIKTFNIRRSLFDIRSIGSSLLFDINIHTRARIEHWSPNK